MRIFGNKKGHIGFIFSLPLLVFYCLIFVYPLISNFILSFYKANLAIGTRQFVGLNNYIALWSDSRFFNSLRITAVFSVGTVFLQLVIGMGLALFLNLEFRGKHLLRGLFLLPWVIPPVLVGILWRWSFDPYIGWLNDLLQKLHLIQNPIIWLGSQFSLFSVIIAQTWRVFPFSMVMVLASLQSVQREIIEAAKVDGAGEWSRFWYVVLPQLKPILSTVILLNIIWNFGFFDLPYILTGGGPQFQSEVTSIYIFKTAFNYSQFGLGTAMAWTLALFILIFSIIYIYITMFRQKL